eukprot:3934585-Rhodomonas_salina.1
MERHGDIRRNRYKTDAKCPGVTVSRQPVLTRRDSDSVGRLPPTRKPEASNLLWRVRVLVVRLQAQQ